MVSPIGAADSAKPRTTGMNRNVVREAVLNAYSAYGHEDPAEYSKHMATFYREGKKHPLVANMILFDTILQTRTKELDDIDNKRDAFIEKVDNEPIYSHGDYLKTSEMKLKAGMDNIIMQVASQRKYEQARETGMADRLTDEVKPLKEEFDAEFNSTYPRTALLRQRFVEGLQVSDTSKTAPKRTIYEKIKLVEPEEGWDSIYPKTAYTRARLIIHNRLDKKGKMSKFKKMLWNTPFIKARDELNLLTKFGISLAKNVK